MTTSRRYGAITKSRTLSRRASPDHGFDDDLAGAALRSATVIILGLDPSLSCCGWAVIRADGNRLTHLANGQIRTKANDPLPSRLVALALALESVISEHRPESAAAEEV